MSWQNFFATKLYSDVSDVATTITLETAPTVTAGRLVLEARNTGQREIIKYTGVAGNQITGVSRGQEGTTARSHLAGSVVEMNLTAQDLIDAMNVPNDIITRFNESLADFVPSGLVWSQTALLVGQMSSGVVYINGIRLVVSAATGIAFGTSKDTYVDIDVTGTLYYTPVANGATTGFTLAANCVRLAKVVTNGSTITSVVTNGLDAMGYRIYPRTSVQLDDFNNPDGVWKTWTPVWSNLTVGSGAIIAKYMTIGKTVHFKLSFIYGAGSAVGTNPKFSLPVPPHADESPVDGYNYIGIGNVLDTGIGNFDCRVALDSTTSANLPLQATTGSWATPGIIGAATPFTWGTGDRFYVHGSYEAA